MKIWFLSKRHSGQSRILIFSVRASSLFKLVDSTANLEISEKLHRLKPHHLNFLITFSSALKPVSSFGSSGPKLTRQ